MSKITTKTNFRVIVEPVTSICGIKLSTVESDCREVADQIKRHVDNVRRVDVEYDVENTCSHCGYSWEVDEETGEPLCCQKAIDEHHSKPLQQ